jgi:predicted nucleic acid-binding protein
VTGYLLDTNVISETRKIRADRGVMAFLSAAEAAGLFVSALTLGELRKGVAVKRRTDPGAADQLGAWVDGLEVTFADRVLPIDIAIARRWGEMSANRSFPVIDSLIAATAMSHGLTLVTRNIRDVGSTGVPLVDPWM